jgi:cytochrome o ubiquinol oxidase subunit 1
MKHGRKEPTAAPAERQLDPIYVPKSSAIGFVTAFFAVIMGFALIWHIWWMAVAGLAGIVLGALVHAWRVEREVEIPVETLAALEHTRREAGATA